MEVPSRIPGAATGLLQRSKEVNNILWKDGNVYFLLPPHNDILYMLTSAFHQRCEEFYNAWIGNVVARQYYSLWILLPPLVLTSCKTGDSTFPVS